MTYNLLSIGELHAFATALRMYAKMNIYYDILREDGHIDEWQAESYNVALGKSRQLLAEENEESDDLIEEQVDILVMCHETDEPLASLSVVIEYDGGEKSDYDEHYPAGLL